MNPLIERYFISLGREIIAYQFVEHEVGRIVILNFSSMNEHSKFDAPCRSSFQFITYMESQGSQKKFPWDENFGRVFKGMKKVMGTCSIFSISSFTPIVVLRYLWNCLNDEGLNYENGSISFQKYEMEHIYPLHFVPLQDKKWVNQNVQVLS